MRLTKRVKRTAVGLIAGFGVGAGVGAMTYGAGEFSHTYDTPEEARERLLIAEETVTAAPRDLQAVEQRIGEACISVMNSYRYDGTLGYVGEDIVVSDLITNAAQPCGNSPTEIRTNIVALRAADEDVASAPSDLEAARVNLENAQDNQFTGEIEDYMLVTGLVFGVGAGTIMNFASRPEDDI